LCIVIEWRHGNLVTFDYRGLTDSLELTCLEGRKLRFVFVNFRA